MQTVTEHVPGTVTDPLPYSSSMAHGLNVEVLFCTYLINGGTRGPGATHADFKPLPPPIFPHRRHYKHWLAIILKLV